MRRLSSRLFLYVSIGIIIVSWVLAFAESVLHLFDFQAIMKLDLAENLHRTVLVLLVKGALTIALVWGLLRLSGRRHADMGFARARLGRQIGIGSLFGLGIFALETFLLSPVLDSIFPKTAAENDQMIAMFRSASNLPLLLALGVLKGGFLEEYWRIFVLTRFREAFARAGLVAALIVGSIAFGLGHSYQGTAAIFSIGIVGLAYALVYLRKGRAVEAVAAHATFDIVAIVLGFLIYHGR